MNTVLVLFLLINPGYWAPIQTDGNYGDCLKLGEVIQKARPEFVRNFLCAPMSKVYADQFKTMERLGEVTRERERNQ